MDNTARREIMRWYATRMQYWGLACAVFGLWVIITVWMTIPALVCSFFALFYGMRFDRLLKEECKEAEIDFRKRYPRPKPSSGDEGNAM